MYGQYESHILFILFTYVCYIHTMISLYFLLNTVDFFIMHTVSSFPNPMHYEDYALWDMHLGGKCKIVLVQSLCIMRKSTIPYFNIMTHVEGFLIYLWWFSGAVIFICPNIWDKAQNHFVPWKHVNDILQVYYTSKILEKIQTNRGDVCSSSSLYTTRNLVVQDVRRI
jgi:hypothetical protein